MHVVILIPTYKEVENLKRLIPLLYTQIYSMRPDILFSTLVVDDNSPDGTRALCEVFVRTYPHFFVSYGDKCGIGAAMKRGYEYALQELQADAVVTYEADFVFLPDIIIDLVDGLSVADVVLASRVNESDFYSSSYSRRIGHFVANTVIAQWIGGLTMVREHTAAGRAIRVKHVLDTVDLNVLPNGYAFFPAILYTLAGKTQRFKELPVLFQDRSVGISKMKLSSAAQELSTALIYALRFRFSK